ncbi:MAG: ROK family protein [Planctomycetes bacterium]|nr:ROK family protein [Planctomycetota bacterium]
MDERIIPPVANHGTMKNYNLTNFMQALRRHAPVSRADISRLTGIDKKCVSMFSNELIGAGFIEEAGIETVSRGRPGSLLDFVPERNFSLGLAVQADRINCAVFEFPNTIRETRVYPLDPDMSAKNLVDAIRRAAQELSRTVPRLAGVGISYAGTVDLRKGIIHSSANLACLNKFPFREPFRTLGLGPVWFEQSARAAALAESWFGQGAAAGNFASVELNIGISVVMVNQSGLYHGPEGFVGELGHVIVQPRGRRCRCGNNGCLEAYMGEYALKEEMRAAGVDPEELFPCSGDGTADAAPHGKAEKILARAGVWLGRGLGTLVNLFNPDSIIVQGDLMRFADTVLPSARKELEKCCLAEKLMLTTVTPSRLLLPDAMGAAALAFPGWFEGGFDEALSEK